MNLRKILKFIANAFQIYAKIHYFGYNYTKIYQIYIIKVFYACYFFELTRAYLPCV